MKYTSVNIKTNWRMKRNSSYPEGPRRVGASLTIPFVIELFNPDAYQFTMCDVCGLLFILLVIER